MCCLGRKWSISNLVIFIAVLSAGTARAQPSTNKDAQAAALETERKVAVGQVEKIVNQTVPAYRRTAGVRVGEFKPGWFHEGAAEPNFHPGGGRPTQGEIYYNYQDVASDLESRIVFLWPQ